MAPCLSQNMKLYCNRGQAAQAGPCGNVSDAGSHGFIAKIQPRILLNLKLLQLPDVVLLVMLMVLGIIMPMPMSLPRMSPALRSVSVGIRKTISHYSPKAWGRPS